MTQPQPRWATREQVAEHVDVHPNTVDRWRAEGRITAYRFGERSIRFDLNEVDAMADTVKQETN